MANEVAPTVKTVVSFLQSENVMASIRAACAKHVTPERLVRIAGAAISRQPKLLECTKESLFLAVTNCAQLGLEPNLLGDAYLVPYFNGRTKKTECQFIPGYRGLISLARRSGELSTIFAEVVHEDDEFKYSLGDSPEIKHIPSLAEDPGKIIYVYAVAKLKDGGTQRVVMTRREIEGIRARSKAKDSGPWVNDWPEMAKKTAIRRLAKYLPLTVELADAVEADTVAEFGDVAKEKSVDAETVADTKPQTRADRARSAAKKTQETEAEQEHETERDRMIRRAKQGACIFDNEASAYLNGREIDSLNDDELSELNAVLDDAANPKE